MYLEVKDLKKSYGSGEGFVQVLKGITTGVEQGDMCVIQGTSGSGKSTFLNCVGGLDTIDSGSVIVDGKEIAGLNQTQLSEYRRDNLGYIFQFYNLVPNLTVRENIQVCEYLTKDPLDMDDLLETLGLTAHQNKFPSQLSGGQQQRVGLARALAAKPSLMLLDEPFGAIDAINRTKLQDELMKIHKRAGLTCMFVTHDVTEALKLGTRIMIMNQGKIQQFDTAKNILEYPANAYVASLLQSVQEGLNFFR